MSLLGMAARNHPQQVGRGGARDDVDDRGTYAGPDVATLLDGPT